MITTNMSQVMPQPVGAKLGNCLVQHARFDEALQKIMGHLIYPTDTKLIFVIGPAGVGKTCVAGKVESSIWTDPALKAQIEANPGCLPSVRFDVPSVSANLRFGWTGFSGIYLEKLEAPIIPVGRTLAEIPDLKYPRPTPDDFVLNAIKYRRPLVTLLDEANHLANVPNKRALLEQMNRLKSFTTRADVLHVFFGTYELVKLINVSGQLARRSEIIHFRRYTTSPNDLKDFARVVVNFQRSIPVAHHINLQTQVQYLHERCIGCVGTLKTWLVKALGHAVRHGRHVIHQEDLEATAFNFKQLEPMLCEALNGEAELADGTEADYAEFRENLGHTKKGKGQQGTLDFGECDDSPAAPKKPSGGPAPKPFEQSPVRRPTGGGRNGGEDLLTG